jgi:hypothetical protein
MSQAIRTVGSELYSIKKRLGGVAEQRYKWYKGNLMLSMFNLEMRKLVLLVILTFAVSVPVLAVQIESFDNFAADGWTDAYAAAGYHPQWLFQEAPAGGAKEGTGCAALKFDLWDGVDPDMYSTIEKVFTPTLDLTGGDNVITFWYWPDLVGGSSIYQIGFASYVPDYQSAYVIFPQPTIAGWNKIVIPLADFIQVADATDGDVDFTNVASMYFLGTCAPDGGNAVYIDDLCDDSESPIIPSGVAQIAIPVVEEMPNHPSPYQMRDWKQVAIDYDNFVFDFTKTGDYLPLIWWDTSRVNFDRDMFGLPDYVGSYFQTGGIAHGAVNCMGAVVGATLAGVDKSDQNGYNWVLMEENYFNSANGENLYLNGNNGDTGNDFWFDILPSMLFYQLAYYYPGTGNFDSEFVTTADRWYDACVGMGGETSPWTVPNFNHTAFDFDTMTPYDGAWTQPDASAAIGLIEYWAYAKLGDQKYLDAADWAMQFIQNQTQGTPYTVFYCFAPYLAARMNAEQDRSYDVDKPLDFCFADETHQWGIHAFNWGGYDVGGLASNSNYSFEMETLYFAGALPPLVRYDQRYARAIGKYMLNVANSVRLFYPGAHDAAHQTCFDWANTYDPDNCIGYEALKEIKWTWARTGGEQTNKGIVVSGSHLDTHNSLGGYQVLREQTVGSGFDGLEHIWHIPLDPGSFYQIVIQSHIDEAGDADDGFDYYYSASSSGPWTYLFNVNSTTDIHRWSALSGLGSDLYVKVQDTNRTSYNNSFDTLHVGDIYVHTEDDTKSPFAAGDPLTSDWGNTDLGLYGSSYIGILGGIVSTTNVEKILQLDLLKTDYYHDAAYPTYLYFNPYNTRQSVDINVGAEAVDLYDTVSQTFLATNVSGNTSFDIPADSAVVVVLAPAGQVVTLDGNKKLIDGVIVDYRTNDVFDTCNEVVASPERLSGDLDRDCDVDLMDMAIFAEQWLADDGLDFDDLTQFVLDWLECNDPAGCP